MTYVLRIILTALIVFTSFEEVGLPRLFSFAPDQGYGDLAIHLGTFASRLRQLITYPLKLGELGNLVAKVIAQLGLLFGGSPLRSQDS